VSMIADWLLLIVIVVVVIGVLKFFGHSRDEKK